MSNWADGYATEIDYTYGSYPGLNPESIKLAFLYKGLQYPKIETACELGFGQGVGINIHASASDIKWYGNDFMPSQVLFANQLAKVSKNNAQLVDDSFIQYAQRQDLPQFDFIGLHGIWSWISDENRIAISEFISKNLKLGGVVYVSYNTLPGWAAFSPMRHLLTQHTKFFGKSGDKTNTRINESLNFVNELMATKPTYSVLNPSVEVRLEGVNQQDRSYISHEYYNQNWQLMYFSDTHRYLDTIKLTYACSADYLSNVDCINLTSEQSQFLDKIPDQIFKETVRDFMVNQQFRRDYWVKGSRKLSASERQSELRNIKIILFRPRSEIKLSISATLNVNLLEQIYVPILDYLADHQPKTIGQIEHHVAEKSITFDHVVEAVMIMVGSGNFIVIQDSNCSENVKNKTKLLNNVILQNAKLNSQIGCLASPITGGAIAVGRIQQLFLLAINSGLSDSKKIVNFVWDILSAQGETLMANGVALKTSKENIEELEKLVNQFNSHDLKILILLGIAQLPKI